MATRPKESPVSDAVGMYLEEVSTHGLLTAEDEVRLARAMDAGRRALHRLEAEGPDLPAEDRVQPERFPSWQYPSDHLSLAVQFARR